MPMFKIIKYSFVLIVLVILLGVAMYAKSIVLQKKSLNAPKVTTTIDKKATTDGSSLPVSVVTFKEEATSTPSISYEYPQFPTLPKEFNDAIASSTLSRVVAFKAELADNLAYERENAALYGNKADVPQNIYVFISSWQSVELTSKYVSIILRYDLYTGGIGGNQDIQTFNYDIASKKLLTLTDIFGQKPNYLEIIASTTREILRQSLVAEVPEYEPDQMLAEGTESNLDNFSHFTMSGDAVTFYFPKYAVAAGAAGERIAVVQRSITK